VQLKRVNAGNLRRCGRACAEIALTPPRSIKETLEKSQNCADMGFAFAPVLAQFSLRIRLFSLAFPLSSRPRK
jgi:hypothetical protein